MKINDKCITDLIKKYSNKTLSRKFTTSIQCIFCETDYCTMYVCPLVQLWYCFACKRGGNGTAFLMFLKEKH